MATVYAAKIPGNDLTNARCAMGTVDIGTLGSRAADDVIYTGCKIPHGAIVTEVSWFVTTACTGGGSSEINSGLSTAAADAAHDTAVEQAVLRRVGSYHADASGEELVLTLATNTWTAGKVTFFAKYYATGDLA